MNPDEFDLEDQLRQALQPKRAPAGFAAKVMARTRAKQPWHQNWNGAITLAMVAGLVMAVVIPVTLASRRQEEERGIEARNQLITALGITKVQIRQVNEKISQRIKRNSPAL